MYIIRLILWIISLIVLFINIWLIIFVKWLFIYLDKHRVSWIYSVYEKQYKKIYNKLKWKEFYSKSENYLINYFTFIPYSSSLYWIVYLKNWKSKSINWILWEKLYKNKSKISYVYITSVNWFQLKKPLIIKIDDIKKPFIIITNK